MLARDFELAALVVDFVKQAHILDGNASLVGKGRCEFDLLLCERTHFGTSQDHNSNRGPLAQNRHSKCRPVPPDCLSLQPAVVRISEHVRDMRRPSLESRSADQRSALGQNKLLLEVALDAFVLVMRLAEASGPAVTVTFTPKKPGMICVTQPRSGLNECVEHCLQVEG